MRFALVINSITKFVVFRDNRHQDWKRRKEKKQTTELQNNIQLKKFARFVLDRCKISKQSLRIVHNT
jgi:hypothetical protein